jgi:hypothetical protein
MRKIKVWQCCDGCVLGWGGLCDGAETARNTAAPQSSEGATLDSIGCGGGGEHVAGSVPLEHARDSQQRGSAMARVIARVALCFSHCPMHARVDASCRTFWS